MSTKEERAAPEGPPRDLVRSRGQELAEAPQDNLSTSHEDKDSPIEQNVQVKPLSLIEQLIQDLLRSGISDRRLARYAPAAADGAVSASDTYPWNCSLCDAPATIRHDTPAEDRLVSDHRAETFPCHDSERFRDMFAQTQKVRRRVADARNDPTFLLAPVEVVATYDLIHLNWRKVEGLLHRFFDAARPRDLWITDRFGRKVYPREWFYVLPEHASRAVKAIRAGNLHEFEV